MSAAARHQPGIVVSLHRVRRERWCQEFATILFEAGDGPDLPERMADGLESENSRDLMLRVAAIMRKRLGWS